MITLLPAVVALIAIVGFAAGALTASPTPGKQLGVAKCTVTGNVVTDKFTAPEKAAKANLVLDISWVATNDEDSGIFGYWALDYYTTDVYVWYATAGVYAGDYYWVQTFSGMFESPQGALSPAHGYLENETQVGTLTGGLEGLISGGTFSPGANPVSGSLGELNYSGTTADLLLGTYGSGQVGDANEYNWYAAYFGSSGTLTEPEWGFVYNANLAFSYGNTAPEWCNFASGNAGDILGD
ncbi:MAG: hypothetical protein WA688_01500 [Thermoplasmata archaeon]